MNLPVLRSTRVLPFIALAAILLCPVTYQFDGGISSLLRQPNLPGDLRKAVDLSEAFAHGVGVFFILLSVLVVAVDRRKQVWVAILITLVSGLMANGMKAAVVRVRPHSEGLQVAGSHSTEVTDPDAVEASFWDARQRSFSIWTFGYRMGTRSWSKPTVSSRCLDFRFVGHACKCSTDRQWCTLSIRCHSRHRNRLSVRGLYFVKQACSEVDEARLTRLPDRHGTTPIAAGSVTCHPR